MRQTPRLSGCEVPPHRESGSRGAATGEVVTMAVEKPNFRCPECLNVFATWTKLTQHLDTTKHFSARCVVCEQQLKCYGPTHPYRHEAATGHFGFFGTFYLRADYQLGHSSELGHSQFICECGVTFMCPLQIALHMRVKHGVKTIPDEAICTTCNIRGTLTEMVQHRMERLVMKEDDVFEIPGFSPAPFLLRRPRRPPWPSLVKPYAILYQCPVCVLVFPSWAAMEGHLMRKTTCRCMLGSVNPRFVNEQSTGALQNIVPEDFEVLLDTSDPEMLSLIQVSPSEHGDVAEGGDLMLMFQCPNEDCSRLFLTHGELREHMEREGHSPFRPEEQTGSASTEWDIAACEVMCSARRLVEELGFSKCPICLRILSSGAEAQHVQLFHATN